MMCIRHTERERVGEANIKAPEDGKRKKKATKQQKKKWMEIVVVLILKPFQFESHL
jgi:hypothetical protein